ncbi:class I SAM-dependent methyltransferase [Tardiphaga sp. 42S5]|uniref:class I SAM-dependent methyltransferase n=1 Tax=Tardiphaga sp. 42S5 TaxID=1404799 RepID=UPI002A5A39B6|nr:class I SAM-dependent methyltransferase [Tardiphaga sp. 42S5]WPO44277.1 class I SAM-dependent methyltransferase [Tardiphaga sp. 42S5]
MSSPERADDASTREVQYNRLLEVAEHHGRTELGLMMNQAWHDDPKRLTFTFARYKFAARMLTGCQNVLEVGCGDAFPSRIVQQEVGKLTVTDFDPIFIQETQRRSVAGWELAGAFVHDMLSGPPQGQYDGMYALDVLEHIVPENEDLFLSNMAASLDPDGTMIIGMPSLESQPYASKLSKEGHVNCKSQPALKETMQRHFHNVYMFCMNDEVLHVGYHKMAHYVFALCCNKKSR